MQFSNNYTKSLLFLTLLLTFISCKSDYVLDSPDQDAISLSELKTLVIRPGMNMVSVEGVIDNPDVTEVKIYWNNKEKSLTVPVANKNYFEAQIDDLDEKLYVFEVQMFDNEGKSSEIISGGAKVYGTDYLKEIKNRDIASSKLENSNLNFAFNPLSLSTGILGTEITYTNKNGKESTFFNKSNKTNINITDFKSGSTLKYRSVFKFSPLALDTIYTAYTNHKPFVLPKLQNASVPYEMAAYDGKRWGDIGAPWITNDAARNHNGFGGYDGKNKIFNIESGWGSPKVTNGKVYQPIELEPATYQLKVNISATNHSGSDTGGAYIVIANGNGLPNVEDLDTATEVLGYERITGDGEYSVEFTVDQTIEVSFGELTTQSDAGRYANINSWELIHVE